MPSRSGVEPPCRAIAALPQTVATTGGFDYTSSFAKNHPEATMDFFFTSEEDHDKMIETLSTTTFLHGREPENRREAICQCGRPTGWHDAQAFDKKVTANDIWIPSKHTKCLPTDAYGTIEFQGGPHPCKAQKFSVLMINKVTLAHLNIRSLLPSLPDLSDYLHLHNFSVFCLSETWLSNNIDSSCLHIDTYTFLRNDRCARGGGVGVYIKKDLTYKLIICDSSIEQLWVSIQLNRKVYAVGIIYRPPQQNYHNFIDVLESTLSEILPRCDSIVLFGDFNIDLNVHDSLPARSLIDAMASLGLSQIITSSTRVTRTSSTLIDLLFVSDESMVLNSGITNLHISDHVPIFCELNVNITRSNVKWHTYRTLKSFNYGAFNADLLSIPFYEIYDMTDIDDMAIFFNNQLANLLNTHMPLVTSRFTRPAAPWLTDTIKTMQTLRDRAFKRYEHSKSPSHWDYYKSLRNLTTEAIRTEKRIYMESKISKIGQNSKKTWKLLRDTGLVTKRVKEIPLHLLNADMINQHFIDSVPTLHLDRVMPFTVEQDAFILKAHYRSSIHHEDGS
ncbi:endonuclease-reverse transcriptase [Holotrichia oblita]|uniref:Endonuclease-reverse transcriptase n=1 Tax=Holotrichia oblita TaxID=644536 RepID=A0ACB9TMV5_HOLOL|nr:endonuclease-reverse transcriptase [Holotrichia oblita]